MIRRRIVLGAALAALALSAAGCGMTGGGGGGGDSAASDAPVAAVPPAQGVAAGDSSGQAVASLGAAAAQAPDSGAGTLESYEAFGTPRDSFDQQVSDESGGGGGVGEATTGGGSASGSGSSGAVVPDVPTVEQTPLVAVPAGSSIPDPVAPATTGGVTTGTTGTEPSTGTPEGTPATPERSMEADFDVSGEPVVAHEGDAIPPDTQQFTVETIGASEVLLKLNGGLLPDGTDTVTLSEGEKVTLYNSTAKKTYQLKLVDIRVAKQ